MNFSNFIESVYKEFCKDYEAVFLALGDKKDQDKVVSFCRKYNALFAQCCAGVKLTEEDFKRDDLNILCELVARQTYHRAQSFFKVIAKDDK